MSIESSLCRELDIRFIDARGLVNLAKLKLDVYGYLEERQHKDIIEEALRIFDQHDVEDKRDMRLAHSMLEASKNQDRSTRSDSSVSSYRHL